MPTIYPNHTKRQLAEGKVALGLGVKMARTVDIAAAGKTCGFDWLFIDMEHGSHDVDSASQIAMAALPYGITPIVRVPGKEHYHASRLLDSGAQGIVVPHVDTVEEAKRAVAYCKYPPVGHRSAMGAMPQYAFQNVSIAESLPAANNETMVIIMVESPEAMSRIDELAAVPGIDSILVGTNDLCAEMGIPGEFTHPKVEDAYRKVVAACKKNNIHPGMGGVYEPKLMEKYIGLGMRFILSGADMSFFMAGAKERASFLHGLKL